MTDNVANESSAPVGGHLVQIGGNQGGVHVHAPPPPAEPGDAALDPPRLRAPVRGRASLLDELTAALDHPDGHTHVLHGLGGCGKTTVAQALAERAAERAIRVFWVRPEDITTAMLWVAVELGAPQAEAARLAGAPKRAPGWVWRWLEASDKPWLLVFDNADHPTRLGEGGRPGDADGWVRASTAGMTLVTTRVGRPEVWEPARMHPVASLEPEQAVRVLRDSADPDSRSEPAALPEAAWRLARRLGGVPLALHLVGRLVREYPLVVPGYADALELVRGSVAEVDHLAEPIVDTENRPERAQRLVLNRVWELSLKLFNGEMPHARPLLAVLSFLGPDGMRVPTRRLDPEVLSGSVVDVGPNPLTLAVLNRAVTSLVAHGLADLRTVNGEPTLGVHPLVAEVTRTNLGENAAGVLDTVTALLDSGHAADPVLEETAYRAVLEGRERTLGADHPDTLWVRHCLAWLAARAGELDKAEGLWSELLPHQERVLGAEHRQTLRTRHQLAELAGRQGALEKAEHAWRSQLPIQTRVLGPDHRDTLWTKHDLAWISLQRKDWIAAQTGFHEVYEARKRLFGSNDPETLKAWLGRAAAIEGQGDLGIANAEYKDLVTMQREALGSSHQATLATRRRIARISAKLGNLAEAETQYRSVLEAQEQRLGSQHQDTLRTRLALAILAGLRERASAEESLHALLRDQETSLGTEHRDTMRTRRALDWLTAPVRHSEPAFALLDTLSDN
ncbi:tetratricopeptide repeat protein [Halostreptopolyspora alba]|uniref:Tetratricopeptide repeat protein n=1 Tax=Halostreptopolyspora alba TaxID=2487137 RepID=A0A3N0EBX6_9ACTN|nr:tetratricopeptide repeat protein [Nocardiopsaceae bacterium YIM 96095]